MIMLKTFITTAAACFVFKYFADCNFSAISFACLVAVNIIAYLIDRMIEKQKPDFLNAASNFVGSMAGVTLFQWTIIAIEILKIK